MLVAWVLCLRRKKRSAVNTVLETRRVWGRPVQNSLVNLRAAPPSLLQALAPSRPGPPGPAAAGPASCRALHSESSPHFLCPSSLLHYSTTITPKHRALSHEASSPCCLQTEPVLPPAAHTLSLAHGMASGGSCTLSPVIAHLNFIQ